MERGTPDQRQPDAVVGRAIEDISRLSIPFAAQLLQRRYMPTRQLTEQERSKARQFREDLFRRRDSVIHRGHAVGWHVHWLYSLYNQRTVGANDLEVMLDNGRAIGLLHRTISDLLVIFDDILLNAVSLLDYQAQFLAWAIAGQGVARWDKLVERIKQQSAEATYGAELIATIMRLDKAWVRRLVDRRNYIAHQTASTAEGANNLDLDRLMATLTVEMPSDARPLLDAMGDAEGNQDLLSGAQHIAITSLRATVELLSVATKAHRLRPGFVPIASL